MGDHTGNVAIVGGGIIGISIAHHLARKGIPDILVLEREALLGQGSTAKAAGGIRAQFQSDINIRLSKRSIELYEQFAEDTGFDVPFNQVGYLWVGSTEKDMACFRANVEKQRALGLDVKLLDRSEVEKRAPYVNTEDVLGAAFHGRDGYAPPAGFVNGYEQAARKQGVKILTSTEVTGIDGTTLTTTTGTVEAKSIVCAAGPWSAAIGRMAGFEIPVEPLRRSCLVTKPLDLPHPIPMTVDRKSGVYVHSESGGVLIGKADPSEKPGFDQTFQEERFVELVFEDAAHRIPALMEAEILTGWGGLYENTPDHHPIIGPMPGRDDFWIVTGFSGHGVMHAPAAGELLAEWMNGENPSIDLKCLRPERFRENDPIKECYVI